VIAGTRRDRTVQFVHETAALAHVTGAAVRTFAIERPKSREELLSARIATQEAHELHETMAALIAEQVLHLAAINLGLRLGHAEHIHEERFQSRHASRGSLRKTSEPEGVEFGYSVGVSRPIGTLASATSCHFLRRELHRWRRSLWRTRIDGDLRGGRTASLPFASRRMARDPADDDQGLRRYRSHAGE
jgi:hypothetical protein